MLLAIAMRERDSMRCSSIVSDDDHNFFDDDDLMMNFVSRLVCPVGANVASQSNSGQQHSSTLGACFLYYIVVCQRNSTLFGRTGDRQQMSFNSSS